MQQNPMSSFFGKLTMSAIFTVLGVLVNTGEVAVREETAAEEGEQVGEQVGGGVGQQEEEQQSLRPTSQAWSMETARPTLPTTTWLRP